MSEYTGMIEEPSIADVGYCLNCELFNAQKEYCKLHNKRTSSHSTCSCFKMATDREVMPIFNKALCFTESGKFLQGVLADFIMRHSIFKTFRDTREIYVYDKGVYRPGGETIAEEKVVTYLGEDAKRYHKEETLFHVHANTYTDRSQFDSDLMSVNLTNGILNMNDMKVYPHSPKVLTTVQLPLYYSEDAECPVIMKFLSEVLEPEEIPIIQELIGYCLLRDYRFQKMFFFTGEGKNGKSTLLQLIKIFLGGKNIASVALQDLTKNRFAVAALYGKLANIYPNLPKKALYQTGVIKMLCGGDEIGAEKKFRDHFSFTNYAKLIFSMNRVPRSDDDTVAFFRRVIFVNFPNTFTEGKNADVNLIKKLTTKEELSGLLRWAIEGLKRLMEQHCFSYSKSTEEVREEYVKRSDPVKAFVMSCCELGIGFAITKEEMYNTYLQYCKENKLSTVVNSVFAKHLRAACEGNLKEEQRRVNGKKVRHWVGIYRKSTEIEVEELEEPEVEQVPQVPQGIPSPKAGFGHYEVKVKKKPVPPVPDYQRFVEVGKVHHKCYICGESPCSHDDTLKGKFCCESCAKSLEANKKVKT